MISALFFTEKAAARLCSQPIHSLGQLGQHEVGSEEQSSPHPKETKPRERMAKSSRDQRAGSLQALGLLQKPATGGVSKEVRAPQTTTPVEVDRGSTSKALLKKNIFGGL